MIAIDLFIYFLNPYNECNPDNVLVSQGLDHVTADTVAAGSAHCVCLTGRPAYTNYDLTIVFIVCCTTAVERLSYIHAVVV